MCISSRSSRAGSRRFLLFFWLTFSTFPAGSKEGEAFYDACDFLEELSVWGGGERCKPDEYLRNFGWRCSADLECSKKRGSAFKGGYGRSRQIVLSESAMDNLRKYIRRMLLNLQIIYNNFATKTWLQTSSGHLSVPPSYSPPKNYRH